MTWPTVGPLRDQDTFDAATINAKLADVRAAVNDIMPGAVRSNALRFAHMASIIPSTPGVQQARHAPATAVDYTNAFPGYASSTIAGTGGGLGGTGWAIISDGTTPLTLSWSSLTLGMGQASRVAAILVRVNLEMELVSSGAAANTANRNHCGVFAICWRNGAGTRTVLQHTQRFEGAMLDNAYNYVDGWHDVSIVTLLTNDVLGAACTGVDALAAFDNPAGANPASPVVRLRRGSIVAIPLHARDPA